MRFHSSLLRRCLALLGGGLAVARAATPAPDYLYLYNAPESATDVRYVYHWEILRAALERTRETHGAFEMRRAKVMSESRQAEELMNASGALTVMYLDSKPEFERRLWHVPIPVDKGLAGYRLFLVRAERRDELRRVATLDDLRRFSYGFGFDWVDVSILRASGFRVVTGSSYDGLFEMLEHRRFDVFLRSAAEVLDEVAQRAATMPDLAIEETLCLHYPLPQYFWFARTPAGRRLADRVEEGMRALIADGTFDRIFDRYYRAGIERLRLKERRLFRIESPLVRKELLPADPRLWFEPRTYTPAAPGKASPSP